MKITEFTIYIKNLRANRNITLRKLAEITGYSAGYLTDLEQGNREPNEKLINILINAYNLDENSQRELFDAVANSTNNIPYDIIHFLKENPEEMQKIRETMENSRTK